MFIWGYQIRHLDEALEPGILLDVESVEGDSTSPWKVVGLQEVLDLVVVNIQSQHLVRRLRHQLLAQVRPYEPSRTDHADRQWPYRVPIQIHTHSRRSHCSFFVCFVSWESEVSLFVNCDYWVFCVMGE